MRPLANKSITAAIAGSGFLMSTGSALAQQPAPSCAWNKYLYAQDAAQQVTIDTRSKYWR